MNKDQVAGKFDQAAGKLKQKVGEAVGSNKLANSGTAQQVKGAAEETWGKVKDTASEVHDTAKAKAAAKSDLKAHDAREKVTSTAQNLKYKIGHKLDEIKHESSHQRKGM